MESIKNVIPTVISRLQDPETLKKSELYNQWTKIIGPKAAPHTKPYLNKSGLLFVWVDESALAFELNQKYRPAILKRVESVLGKGVVKDIQIRVGQIR